MSLINNIQNALNNYLSGIAGLPTIYYPNVSKEPIQGTEFLRPTLLPANSELFTVNNENRHIGIYQIDIFTDLKKGTAPLWLIADAIRDGFKTIKSVSSGGDTVFIQEISISQAQRIESWWSCFVQINYLCFN